MRQIVARVAASAAGRLLATGLGALAFVRGGKPLHPRGQLFRAVLEITDPLVGGGPFLEVAGSHQGLCRRATAIGLPSPLPDIDGLALRLPTDDGDADILFAATGTGRWSQHLLSFHRAGRRVPVTTLFPFVTDAGPVVLGLFPEEAGYALRASVASGRWRDLGRLRLDAMAAWDQPELRFDPTRNAPPGLGTSPALVRLRDPAYVAARRRG